MPAKSRMFDEVDTKTRRSTQTAFGVYSQWSHFFNNAKIKHALSNLTPQRI